MHSRTNITRDIQKFSQKNTYLNVSVGCRGGESGALARLLLLPSGVMPADGGEPTCPNGGAVTGMAALAALAAAAAAQREQVSK